MNLPYSNLKSFYFDILLCIVVSKICIMKTSLHLESCRIFKYSCEGKFKEDWQHISGLLDISLAKSTTAIPGIVWKQELNLRFKQITFKDYKQIGHAHLNHSNTITLLVEVDIFYVCLVGFFIFQSLHSINLRHFYQNVRNQSDILKLTSVFKCLR